MFSEEEEEEEEEVRTTWETLIELASRLRVWVCVLPFVPIHHSCQSYYLLTGFSSLGLIGADAQGKRHLLRLAIFPRLQHFQCLIRETWTGRHCTRSLLCTRRRIRRSTTSSSRSSPCDIPDRFPRRLRVRQELDPLLFHPVFQSKEKIK